MVVPNQNVCTAAWRQVLQRSEQFNRNNPASPFQKEIFTRHNEIHIPKFLAEKLSFFWALYKFLSVQAQIFQTINVQPGWRHRLTKYRRWIYAAAIRINWQFMLSTRTARYCSITKTFNILQRSRTSKKRYLDESQKSKYTSLQLTLQIIIKENYNKSFSIESFAPLTPTTWPHDCPHYLSLSS